MPVSELNERRQEEVNAASIDEPEMRESHDDAESSGRQGYDETRSILGFSLSSEEAVSVIEQVCTFDAENETRVKRS